MDQTGEAKSFKGWPWITEHMNCLKVGDRLTFQISCILNALLKATCSLGREMNHANAQWLGGPGQSMNRSDFDAISGSWWEDTLNLCIQPFRDF